MIGFVVGSLIVGVLARALVPSMRDLSLPMTALVGALGSLIGGGLVFFLRIGSVWALNVLGFALSVIAAVVLLMQADRNGLLTCERSRGPR